MSSYAGQRSCMDAEAAKKEIYVNFAEACESTRPFANTSDPVKVRE
jgi:hypothetical protein